MQWIFVVCCNIAENLLLLHFHTFSTWWIAKISLSFSENKWNNFLPYFLTWFWDDCCCFQNCAHVHFQPCTGHCTLVVQLWAMFLDIPGSNLHWSWNSYVSIFFVCSWYYYNVSQKNFHLLPVTVAVSESNFTWLNCKLCTDIPLFIRIRKCGNFVLLWTKAGSLSIKEIEPILPDEGHFYRTYFTWLKNFHLWPDPVLTI